MTGLDTENAGPGTNRAAVKAQILSIALLILCGAMLAGLLTAAAAARAAGTGALQTVIWQAAGAGLILALLALPSRPRLSRPLLEYGFLSGLTAIAIPNLILFWILAEISAGQAATALAATPVMTALISLVWQRKPLGLLGWSGVVLGTGGVAILTGAGTEGGVPPRLLLALAFVTLVLSFGNVYRTVKWPHGAGVPTLAAAMKLSVGIPMAAAMLLIDPGGLVPPAEAIPATVALIAFSVVAYLAFFALQRHGGPVVLSMIGGVIAFFGGLGDWAIAGMPPGFGFVPGLLLLAAGVILVSRRPPAGPA